MTITDIGAEPIAVWDTREESWWPLSLEKIKWAQGHIADAVSTYRAEFYLVDAPFAVLYRHARDEQGRIPADPATGLPETAGPVTQILDELPPAHLLRA